MGFGEAIASCFGKYATFSGRAPRSEFWWWVLFKLLVGGAIGVIGGMLDSLAGVKTITVGLVLLTDLFFLLPDLAVGVRRLHDRNHSGWWFGLFFFLWVLIGGLSGPILIRVAENHHEGLPPGTGLPEAAYLALAALLFINLVLALVLFIWYLLPGTKGNNRFGPDPLRDPF